MGMLYDFVLSKPNIYQAIYSMESYVVEKYLLSNDDIILYKRLADKYDYTLMEEVIGKCRKRLEILLDKRENLFEPCYCHITSMETYLQFEWKKSSNHGLLTINFIMKQ